MSTEATSTTEHELTAGSRSDAVSGYISERPVRDDSRAGASLTFSTIVADPPWEVQASWSGTSHKVKSAPMPYGMMSKYEIAAMPVRNWAARDAHLYLWTINAYVVDTYWIAQAWGFTPSTLLTWSKPAQGVHGGDFVTSSEFVLFCRRGHPKAKRRQLGTVFEWPRGAHSAKPEAFIDLVESISPGPYLELFARRNRLGWSTWGNECLNHIGAVAPADSGDNGRTQVRREP